jgi:hydrophobe/amphiphile efflux-1 (HAE1) family protein
MDYMRIYDPTTFVSRSIHEVLETIVIAILLVVSVVFVFLQTWRATIIPVVAIPISLLGTFIILALFGISINNLSLFGLILAVGIVVDDAIVVVENVERNMARGMNPKEASHKTMDEVSSALIAIAVTLCAVFVPSVFITGISGLFFTQFAVTISASAIISAIVSLTLSPALCAVLLKPHHHDRKTGAARISEAVFGRFNNGFNWLSSRYGKLTAKFVRATAIVGVVYFALIALTGFQMSRLPTGFIPEQDIGYQVVVVILPPGSSLQRTDTVVREVNDTLLKVEGVEHTVPISGLDVTTSTIAPNVGSLFYILPSQYGKNVPGITAASMLPKVKAALAGVKDAVVVVVNPPAVQGLGSAGGFKLMVEDRGDHTPQELADATNKLVTAANQDPAFAGVFTFYNAGAPSLFVDIDREKAEKLGVTATDVFSTMQLYMGSQYVNDFNYLGRTYPVFAQADQRFRKSAEDISHLKVRNSNGEMVPIGSVATFMDTTAPYRQPRYNLYSAADVLGAAAPGVSSGAAIEKMNEIAEKTLPPGFDIEWTELSHQELQHGIPTIVIFAASALFVFLVLAAQYESWKLPLAIVLIVPMCLLASATGLSIRGIPLDILGQIGFVVLVGLAAKNAILIVEFAKQHQDLNHSTPENAAVEAAQVRLRPILMTSFAFILGVFPLAVATGAGAEMRQSLGISVFSGMIGVTLFGLIFTPAFYTLIQRIGTKRSIKEAASSKIEAESETEH